MKLAYIGADKDMTDLITLYVRGMFQKEFGADQTYR